MVMQLGLGKFYGKSLPRPRIYEDVKFNAERVDPPTPPTAPLISWARDASWSMGGMSSKRKRMQGKIEGSLKELRDLQDDDDDEKAVDVGVAPDGKTSNPSFVDTRSANEELLTSDEDTEGCSTETSLGVRTPAEKLNEVGLSSSRWIRKGRPNDMRVNEEGGVSDASEGSDSVTGNAFLRRGSRGRKKHDSARAEPVISRRVTVASVRRSGRSSVLRRIRN